MANILFFGVVVSIRYGPGKVIHELWYYKGKKLVLPLAGQEDVKTGTTALGKGKAMNTLPDKAQIRKQPAVDMLMQKVVRGIEDYAGQAMAGVSAEIVAGLADRVAREILEFSVDQGNHLHQLVKIGLGLSSEKNIDRLLERIVREARLFTNADGGTLYIRESELEVLDFAIVQNDSLGVFMGGERGSDFLAFRAVTS